MEEMIAEVPAEPEKPQEVAPAEAEKPPEVAPAPVLKRSRRPRRPRAKVTRPKEKPAPEAVPVQAPPIAIPLPEKKEEETLLLAKSSYIQEGQANRREAVRISKILKAFRWNVEPVYTIGVILDDNMSIETNKSEISASLIRQIEIAGYKLSAVTATSGKPTAWFKRKPSLDLPAPTPPAESAAQLRGKVEELSRTLQEERQRAEEQKALWEARFVQLMRLVEIKKSEETETVAGNDASEPQPEPDVAS